MRLRGLCLAVLLAMLPGCRGGQHGETTELPSAAERAEPPDMVDPAIDEGPGPFSYYSRPTDVIGVMDGRGTEVTPEGYLFTGSGELMFMAGPTLMPVSQRIRTLRDGWLPVIEYDVRRGDVDYHFTLFAATLDGAPTSPVADFVRVTMTNTGSAPALARVAFAVRYTAPSYNALGVPDHRFPRPVKAPIPGEYEQPGEAFDTAWTYGFENGAFLRGGKVLYLYPTDPAPQLRLTPDAPGVRVDRIAPTRLVARRTTPVGETIHDAVLLPGASRQLVVKLPYAPVAPDDPWLAKLRAADFDTCLARTESFWQGLIGRGMHIGVAEPKVVNAFRASLVYDLLARDDRGGDYIQNVDEFHYHAFWLRDASYIARSYDVTGYPRIASQVLDFFARWQKPNGNFVSQGGQYDGWGQALWAYGQHWRLTRDTAFAGAVLPAIRRAVDWLRAARERDSLHLMPATTPGDNEDVTGHVTGQDFWALAGLHGAVDIAEGMGRKADAAEYRAEYDSLRATLLARLRSVTSSTGGYIPPRLDGPGGQDWGNMMAVYPEQVLEPHDPMVTATLDSTRAKYAEGIMTYGDGFWLHDYLTMKNTETEVVRGDQETALAELYAVLLHTSSTHAGFEYKVRPWGTRDFGRDIPPHGCFAAMYRTLLRNMLVREQADTLHLLSVLSPAWLQPGDSVVVRRAPTNFGPVDFRLDVLGDTAATLDLYARFTRPPASLVIHVPWFVDLQGAQADGRTVEASHGALKLSPDLRRVVLRWVRRPGIPELSYQAAVDAYRKEYRRRWEAWTQGRRTVPTTR